MNYCAVLYLLVFLPILIVVYNLVKEKHRSKVLLLASWIFFVSISGKLIIYLLASIFSIHHFGLWLNHLIRLRDDAIKEASKEEAKDLKKQYQKRMKHVFVLGILLHLGFLLFMKYVPFLSFNINNLLSYMGFDFSIKVPHLLVPIGLSFYTLEALSYLFDVMRGTIKADDSLFNLALYLSYFPTIMEGPIVRYHEFLPYVREGKRVSMDSLARGFLRIIYGLIKKIVVADRVNALIKAIFVANPSYESGGLVAMGAIFYTIQLYMEFSGTMDVVIGSSEIFNIKLPENFRNPFFSRSVSEFWSRWHITLGTWFKDYLFYPISLSKPSKKITRFFKKFFGKHAPLVSGSVALLVVWLCNGFWHGAGWMYIFFGMYHFTLIVLGNIFEPIILKIYQTLKIRRECFFITVLRIFKTTVLVIIGELFFRAPGLRAGLTLFKILVTKFSLTFITNKEYLNLGIDWQDYIIVGVTLVMVSVVGILREKNVDIRSFILGKPIAIRWIIYYLLIFYLLIFGAYGMNYTPVDPIYAGF